MSFWQRDFGLCIRQTTEQDPAWVPVTHVSQSGPGYWGYNGTQGTMAYSCPHPTHHKCTLAQSTIA